MQIKATVDKIGKNVVEKRISKKIRTEIEKKEAEVGACPSDLLGSTYSVHGQSVPAGGGAKEEGPSTSAAAPASSSAPGPGGESTQEVAETKAEEPAQQQQTSAAKDEQGSDKATAPQENGTGTPEFDVRKLTNESIALSKLQVSPSHSVGVAIPLPILRIRGLPRGMSARLAYYMVAGVMRWIEEFRIMFHSGPVASQPLPNDAGLGQPPLDEEQARLLEVWGAEVEPRVMEFIPPSRILVTKVAAAKEGAEPGEEEDVEAFVYLYSRKEASEVCRAG